MIKAQFAYQKGNAHFATKKTCTYFKRNKQWK